MSVKTIMGTFTGAAHGTCVEDVMSALADKIGWNADGGKITHPKSDLWINLHWFNNNTRLGYNVGNTSYNYTTDYEAGVLTLGYWASTSTTTATLYANYLVTDYTTAIGFSCDDDNRRLSVVVTQNTGGQYVMLCVGGYISSTAATNGRYIHQFTSNGSYHTLNYIGTSLCNENGCATALARMPDVWNGGMFQDVYYVLSCPFNNFGQSFLIGGKTFYQINNKVSGYGGLAVMG